MLHLFKTIFIQALQYSNRNQVIGDCDDCMVIEKETE